MYNMNHKFEIETAPDYMPSMKNYRTLLNMARELMASGDAGDRYDGIQLLDDLYRL